MQPRYYSEYYDVENAHWWFRARRRILRTVLEQAGLWGSGLLVLDVGSGTGRMPEFLGEGFRVVAADREMEALRFAARRDSVRLLQADALALPVRPGSVDVVSAFDIIEHLEDDEGALREFRRTLKPGGHCVMTVPAFPSLWSEHDDINMHRRRYRRPQLRRRVVAAGFDVVRCTYFNALLFPPIAAVRLGARLLGSVRRRRPAAPRSDLSSFRESALGAALERLMGSEAEWLRRHDIPAGVSIVCVARKSSA